MTKVRSRAVQVNAQDAEKIRVLLRDMDILRKDLKIRRIDEYVYFPLVDGKTVPSDLLVKDIEFNSISFRPKSYRDVVDAYIL
jgi:tRNA G37 N-methylase Trm5